MAIRTIRVTPTLDTSAYAVGDVLFVGTEVTLPAKSCFLRGVQAVVKDTDGASQEINLLFFQKNTTALGTINATANISGANLLANKYLGVVVEFMDSALKQIQPTRATITSSTYKESTQ
jgi:hypothetical protein